jgi:hypothetical protein
MNRMRFFGMERKKMSSGHWNGKYYALESAPQTCNTRLHEVQAAVLLVKLKHIDEWIERRRQIAKRYDEELPEEVKNALGQRNSLGDEQKRLLIVLANLGLNGTTIPFSARELVPVSGGFAEDDRRLRRVIDLVKNSGDPMVRRQLRDIEKNVRQFNQNKRQIKSLQNKITSLEKKL